MLYIFKVLMSRYILNNIRFLCNSNDLLTSHVKMIQQQKSCDLLIYSKTFFFLFFFLLLLIIKIYIITLKKWRELGSSIHVFAFLRKCVFITGKEQMFIYFIFILNFHYKEKILTNK